MASATSPITKCPLVCPHIHLSCLDANLRPAPTPLPSPEAGLVLGHVAFGRGTQNYTCSSASAKETPVQVGAVAQLYNVTCTSVRAPSVLSDIPALSLVHAIPENDVSKRLISGHHEFTSDGVPLFVLNSNNNQLGFVTAGKNASSPAPSDCSKGPNGLGSVPWLRLLRKDGDYKEVYRIDTAGGVAPKTCEGVNGAFQIEYSALYYFWK